MKMKRDNGKFIFVSAAVALVMIVGLYIDSLDIHAVKYSSGRSTFSVDIEKDDEQPEQTAHAIILKKSDKVYVTKSGTKFHIKNDCGQMNPDNASEITVEDALNRGLGPCKRCLKDATIEQ